MRQMGVFATAVFLSCAASGRPVSGDVRAYGIVDLGTLPGGASSEAFAINSLGQVVGRSYAQDEHGFGRRAFLYAHGTMTNLGLADVTGALYSSATAVNDAGVVGGQTSNGIDQGFLFENGVMRPLHTPPGAIGSSLRGINAAGHAVGEVVVPVGDNQYEHHAFLYADDQMTDLNPVFGQDYSDAAAINDSGWIVGQTRTDGLNIRGYILRDGEVTYLDTLGGANSEASAISPSGLVAGSSYLASNSEHAFLYDGESMLDLGLLPGATASTARGVNDDGTVVGSCRFPGGYHASRAFQFSGGQMHDLNEMIPAGSGWSLLEANAINSTGQIAGAGRINGQTHAFLLMPAGGEKGDLNCDGVVNNSDIDPFVLALLDGDAYQSAFPGCAMMNADMNGDNRIDNSDIDAFVARLLGG